MRGEVGLKSEARTKRAAVPICMAVTVSPHSWGCAGRHGVSGTGLGRRTGGWQVSRNPNTQGSATAPGGGAARLWITGEQRIQTAWSGRAKAEVVEAVELVTTSK